MRVDPAPSPVAAEDRCGANGAFSILGKNATAPFPEPGRAAGWGLRLLPLWLLCAGAPAGAADVIRGGELYRQHCVVCHGTNGRPQMVGAPDFSQPKTLLKPDMTLLQSIRTGKGAMPAYQGLLRDRELLDIVAHLRTLR